MNQEYIVVPLILELILSLIQKIPYTPLMENHMQKFYE